MSVFQSEGTTMIRFPVLCCCLIPVAVIAQVQKPPTGSRINWSHPLSAGLVSLVPLNEGSGSTFSDAATQLTYPALALSGTPANAQPPAWITPPVTADYPWAAPAVSNNGATAKAIQSTVQTQFIPTTSTGYSYAVLVQPLDAVSFGRIMDGTGAAVITLYLNAPGKLGMVSTTWRIASGVSINPAHAFVANKWILVLCTIQQGLGIMYVNGVEVLRDTTVNLAKSVANQTGQLAYNSTGNGSMMCNANFSSWWVWNNRVLTAQEVAQMYANPWAMLVVYSAPVLTLPANITVPATTKSGAVVTFSGSANDTVDGALTPVFTPPSGSDFPIGTTTVTASATDSGGLASTGSFTVTVQRTYAAFQDQYGLANADPTADTNHIGVRNLAAYALGVNPSAPDRSMLPSVAVQNGYLQISYPRWTDAADLTYLVEVSGDLKTWNSGSNYTHQVSVTPIDGSREQVVERDLIPAGSAMRRFMHLRITQ
jgi:hypothetical protein